MKTLLFRLKLSALNCAKAIVRKPMAQPYEGCQCSCCVPTGTPPRCNHDNCDMEAADGGIVRWSCGSVEG